MRKILGAVTAAAFALPLSIVSAQDVTNIGANFNTPVPGAPATQIVPGTDPLICWGNNEPSATCDGLGETTSGYGFDSGADFGGEGTFSMGLFTHFNQAIFPPSLETVNLGVGFNLAGLGPQAVQWAVTHTETSNTGTVGNCTPSGVTVCPDVVSFAWDPFANQSVYNYAGGFTLTILGFGTSLLDPNLGLNYDFVTEEDANTPVTLYAQITGPNPGVVPEPSSVALMALGLAGMGMAARRRKNV